MNVWNARAAWDRRRKETKMITPDQIINATAAWLNGNERHAMEEGLTVESATVVDSDLVVVTFLPMEEGKVSFRATFKLAAIETETFAKYRHSQSEQGRDA